MRKFWLGVYFLNAVLSGVLVFMYAIIFLENISMGQLPQLLEVAHVTFVLILTIPAWIELIKFDKGRFNKRKRGYAA